MTCGTHATKHRHETYKKCGREYKRTAVIEGRNSLTFCPKKKTCL